LERSQLNVIVCGGKLCYSGGGRYKCPVCGKEDFDDLGKVRKFLDENGPAPIIAISQATGVDKEVIEFFNKNKQIRMSQVKLLDEKPEDAMSYVRKNVDNNNIKCARCGKDIQSGRYCLMCIKNLASGLKSAFDGNTASARNIVEPPRGAGHRMYYMDKR